MQTMLQRKEAATGRRDRVPTNISLVEQKRLLDEATRKTVGLASRAFRRTLELEMKKLGFADKK